jgi:hypothetical protein
MTDLSLAPGDPTRTIHFFVGRTLRRIQHTDAPQPRMGDVDSALACEMQQDDPDIRRSVGYMISISWVLFAFAFVVLMLATAIPAGLLFGDRVAIPIANVCAAGSFFCIAGFLNVYWRTFTFVPEARRLARGGESMRETYAAAMRRTLPRNSSLVFQTAVFALTLLIAFA